MSAPPPPAVAVVVLLYNSRDVVESCLDGLRATEYPDLEVIVVDNASSDDSLGLAERHPLRPRVIRSGANRGWAGGNNLGVVAALRAGKEYVVLLNPDVELRPDWLRDAIAAMEADPTLGMLDFEGLDGSRIVPPDSPPPLHATDVTAVIGAVLVARASALRRIGPIDERYFLYFEDGDWSQRARAAGYRVARLNRALGHTPELSSSDRKKLLRAWLSMRNSILMRVKHSPGELPGWIWTLARHAVSRRPLHYAHLLRLRPYGPLRNLALLAGAVGWNVAALPATLASLRAERRYREAGWDPGRDGAA